MVTLGITEIINLILHLNVKQMTVAGKKRKCEGCQMERTEGEDCLKTRILGGNHSLEKCTEKECMVLCYWMMQKHDWLVKELIALNDYLFTVNNTMFNTKINFIIRYRDEVKLDADMFDSVQDYLEA